MGVGECRRWPQLGCGPPFCWRSSARSGCRSSGPRNGAGNRASTSPCASSRTRRPEGRAARGDRAWARHSRNCSTIPHTGGSTWRTACSPLHSSCRVCEVRTRRGRKRKRFQASVSSNKNSRDLRSALRRSRSAGYYGRRRRFQPASADAIGPGAADDLRHHARAALRHPDCPIGAQRAGHPVKAPPPSLVTPRRISCASPACSGYGRRYIVVAPWLGYACLDCGVDPGHHYYQAARSTGRSAWWRSAGPSILAAVRRHDAHPATARDGGRPVIDALGSFTTAPGLPLSPAWPGASSGGALPPFHPRSRWRCCCRSLRHGSDRRRRPARLHVRGAEYGGSIPAILIRTRARTPPLQRSSTAMR